MTTTSYFSVELSQHFDWSEANTTSHREIDNTIPPELYPVIKNTARGMERIRNLLGKPVSVNSWYRCPELNKAVGSTSKFSQHMAGEAVDFISPKYGTPFEIVKKLVKYRDLINYDQLILEHSWVHVSFVSVPNALVRKQVLTLLADKTYASGITDKFGTPV